MIYTNKVLELSKDEKGRKRVELCSLYGEEKTLNLDVRLAPYINEIREGYHRDLTILKSVKGETLFLTNRTSTGIQLILDTLDYKFFSNNGQLFTIDSNDIEVIVENTTKNRSGSYSWKMDILKIKEEQDKVVVIKVLFTSGVISYITVYNGMIKCHPYIKLKKYLEDIKQTEILEKVDKYLWEEIKQD